MERGYFHRLTYHTIWSSTIPRLQFKIASPGADPFAKRHTKQCYFLLLSFVYHRSSLLEKNTVQHVGQCFTQLYMLLRSCLVQAL